MQVNLTPTTPAALFAVAALIGANRALTVFDLAVLVIAFFIYMYGVVSTHVPSKDHRMVMFWGAAAAACCCISSLTARALRATALPCAGTGVLALLSIIYLHVVCAYVFSVFTHLDI